MKRLGVFSALALAGAALIVGGCTKDAPKPAAADKGLKPDDAKAPAGKDAEANKAAVKAIGNLAKDLVNKRDDSEKPPEISAGLVADDTPPEEGGFQFKGKEPKAEPGRAPAGQAPPGLPRDGSGRGRAGAP